MHEIFLTFLLFKISTDASNKKVLMWLKTRQIKPNCSIQMDYYWNPSTYVGYDWVACNIIWHNPYMEHSNQLTTYGSIPNAKGNIIKFFIHFTKEKFYLPFHHDKIFVGNRTIISFLLYIFREPKGTEADWHT